MLFISSADYKRLSTHPVGSILLSLFYTAVLEKNTLSMYTFGDSPKVFIQLLRDLGQAVSMATATAISQKNSKTVNTDTPTYLTPLARWKTKLYKWEFYQIQKTPKEPTTGAAEGKGNGDLLKEIKVPNWSETFGK